MNRQIYQSVLVSDYIVVGGGLAGVCSAITAARQGIKVILIQDRPVLGGNASSEVRVWALGAAAHMNTNNRWSREGGVIDEILVENLHTNPEGNPYFFDDLLLDKVLAEPLITLLLNTAVNQVQCDEITGNIIKLLRLIAVMKLSIWSKDNSFVTLQEMGSLGIYQAQILQIRQRQKRLLVNL